MSVKVIPEKRLVQCDFCFCQCDDSIKILRRRDGHVAVHQLGLSVMGDVAGNADDEYDLCDSCLKEFNDALTRLISGIRSRQA